MFSLKRLKASKSSVDNWMSTLSWLNQDRVRSGEASSLEYFELGAVMLRKKYYQLANKYLDQAIKKWDGSEQDLAQVISVTRNIFYHLTYAFEVALICTG